MCILLHPLLSPPQVFDCMPLCALIQEKIFVVHGGLFSREGVALEHIRGISRKREPPVHSEVFEVRACLPVCVCVCTLIPCLIINFTYQQTRPNPSPQLQQLQQDRLYEEMLWSDPRTGLSGKQLSSRGAGIEFGQEVTFDFLRTNQLALIVRSHECVNEGKCVSL
jgi:protein phosphatase